MDSLAKTLSIKSFSLAHEGIIRNRCKSVPEIQVQKLFSKVDVEYQID
jgi:hypothetical protein